MTCCTFMGYFLCISISFYFASLPDPSSLYSNCETPSRPLCLMLESVLSRAIMFLQGVAGSCHLNWCV